MFTFSYLVFEGSISDVILYDYHTDSRSQLEPSQQRPLP